MNDTTRDELIERIAELADQFACGAAGEPVVYALHGPMDFAEEVVSIVTAARDAEIREQAMTREITEAGVKCYYRSEGGLLSDCEFDALPETRRRMLTEAASEVIFGAMTAILGPRPQEATNDHE